MAMIHCENINRRISVPDNGVNLRAALLSEGVRLYKWPKNYRPLNCGGKGLCGTCRIEVVENANHLSPITGKEQFKLGPHPENLRLACQCLVQGDVTIRTFA
jgi:ferredoxin